MTILGLRDCNWANSTQAILFLTSQDNASGITGVGKCRGGYQFGKYEIIDEGHVTEFKNS
jgi:hypothetical protein